MLMNLSSTEEELSRQPQILLLLVPGAMDNEASCHVRMHILTGRKRAAAPSHPSSSPLLLDLSALLAAVPGDAPHIRK